ncbi:zinc finger protein [Saccharopolyspora hattusasensis]|uniref:zinc finger protein n=1 Tax=Saccharopolyspora hattusasensis TaxID=1128679 RepID=UPI003D97F110
MYRPHPFSWVPGAEQRHATIDDRPPGGWRDGETVTTLCDLSIQAKTSELAWLWDTCPDCNAAAHVLAQCPMPPAAGAR